MFSGFRRLRGKMRSQVFDVVIWRRGCGKSCLASGLFNDLHDFCIVTFNQMIGSVRGLAGLASYVYVWVSGFMLRTMLHYHNYHHVILNKSILIFTILFLVLNEKKKSSNEPRGGANLAVWMQKTKRKNLLLRFNHLHWTWFNLMRNEGWQTGMHRISPEYSIGN